MLTRNMVAIPIDILVATFGGVLGIAGYIKKFKSTVDGIRAFKTGAKLKLHERSVILYMFDIISNKYDRLMKFLGGEVVSYFYKQLLSVKPSALTGALLRISFF